MCAPPEEQETYVKGAPSGFVHVPLEPMRYQVSLMLLTPMTNEPSSDTEIWVRPPSS